MNRIHLELTPRDTMMRAQRSNCPTRFSRHWLAFLFIGCASLAWMPEIRAAEPSVRIAANGQLGYARDAQGNGILDFSHCGYQGSESDIPQVPVQVVVAPVDGDDGQRIQAALDYVASLPANEDGFRGAIRLSAGEYQIAGQLLIRSSGIVLQGSGAEEGGTVVRAIGQGRRALIRVIGIDDRNLQNGSNLQNITDEYVPVGSNKLSLASTVGYSVGDSILITRPSTLEWIADLGGRAFGVGWKPGTRDIHWDRTITDISENSITLDAPITTALEARYGGGTVQGYEWPGRLECVGIEDLCLISSCSSENPVDEDHSWYGITMDNVQNAWVRRTTFHHFAGGAVHLGRNTKSITVEDCISLAPISELGGYRRHTFFTLGQTSLFSRCWSEKGIHDFSVGHCAAGPIAFVQCYADQALGASGPLESWASGVLYDNVRINGNDLQLQNRWNTPPGTGWSAANCVLWQCRAANVRCFRPPGANNWSIGVWATVAGDGVSESVSDAVKPQSLYQAQLRQRVGEQAADRINPILGRPVGATSPTYEEAARFLTQSTGPARQLVDLIRDNIARITKERAAGSSQVAAGESISIEQVLSKTAPNAESVSGSKTAKDANLISIDNGWLVTDSGIKTGLRLTPSYWKGSIRALEAPRFGINISRFAPGRVGRGLTEDLESVANHMVSAGLAAYEHHYGLWYDRRRDDHLMVRRSDGEVAPPFFEQPFARSGQGVAWDGLSKYDLNSFSPWYWNRLHDFAQLCDERGLLIFHQNYFQHNILEAGGHWADCPWRPANNINDMGLPEPPPYIGDKRLFMAQHFYDVTDPERRTLHRRYIHQCLDALADCTNVLQMISAEFTGPLEFTQFWLDTIVEWEQEKGANVFIALSCTKDVQDAILADTERGPHVDIIDIRYWTYDRDFKVYAPESGKYLSPRQHMRQLGAEPASFASIAKAVSEYRKKYPEKAIIYNADRHCRTSNDGWAVLMGGGSLPNVKLPAELAQLVPKMQPSKRAVDGSDQWCLASPDGSYLVYTRAVGKPIDVHVLGDSATYQVRSVNTTTGKVVATDRVKAESLLRITPKANAVWISRVEGTE